MLENIGKKAREAQKSLSTADAQTKNRALELCAELIEKSCAAILSENEADVESARASGMSESMLDRLRLTEERIYGISAAIRNVITLNDPIGEVIEQFTAPSGLEIKKVRVPLGVIAVIYEARPNVTADAAALCLKTGNCVILRGGKEAFNSNNAICSCMRQALELAGLSPDCISLVQDTTRASALELMRMNKYVDVIIPRGGAGLIKACVESSTVPVIETGTGNCHAYVDKYAPADMAVSIIKNAKLSRVSVCNSLESVVIHSDVYETILPKIEQALAEKGVIFHADERARAVLKDSRPATELDYAAEYLGYEISVKVVDSLEQAIEHINKYSTGHSECIITQSAENAEVFLNSVDSAAVYHNASTRFTDGGEFGFGAEIGISTQKIHARGPLGLRELTSYKYKIYGNGQIR